MPKAPKVKQTQIIFDGPLPFPPDIDVDYLLEKSRCKNPSKPGKSPNCFLIYRIYWTEHLKKLRIKVDLGDMSNFVSVRWQSEGKEVKEYYKKLSNVAKEKYIANNPLRVVLYTNRHDSGAKKNRSVTSSISTGSQKTPVSAPISDNLPVADSITFPHISTFQSQFSTNFFPSPYISSDIITPIISGPNFQNCSLKDTFETLINFFRNTLTLEHYSKLFPATAPGELDRVKIFLDQYMSITIENFSSSVYNRLSVIGDKIKELKMESEPATSNLFIGNTNNNFINSFQDSDFDLIKEPSEGYYWYTQSYQSMQETFPVIDYSGYPVDNPFSNSQLNNNNNISLTYLKSLERKLDDISRRDKRANEKLEEIEGLINGLISGNK